MVQKEKGIAIIGWHIGSNFSVSNCYMRSTYKQDPYGPQGYYQKNRLADGAGRRVCI